MPLGFSSQEQHCNGKADSTLFTHKVDKDIFFCEIYVDDIIFGSTDKKFCKEFSRIMTKRFEISMMGELKFFLGFQVKQMKEGTFICQTKYAKDMLKKFDMADAKPIKTPMALNGHLDLNEELKSVDQKVYHSMNGYLLYLWASRSDIMLSVCMCAKFQATTCRLPQRYCGVEYTTKLTLSSDTTSALGVRISLDAFKRNPPQPRGLT
jgi:hypothetical protein